MLRNALIATALFCLPATMACAQEGLTTALAQRAKTNPNAEMVVKAREMIYDNDKNTVTAVGDVQIYYDGRVLQADRVIYDRASNRVKAVGNAKITDADGTITYADSFDLTDDFRDGFVNSLKILTVDKTRLAAARAERTEGNITVFQKGVYTACEPCKEHPEKPPLWQVKAARIIHNDQEKMIYFEDAHLEFFGMPVAYLPYLSSPDPSVKRKSGILAPTYFATSELGFGLEVPYFFNLAPNYDLTLTPGFTSRQGPILKGEWRHRLITGSYSIRAAGVFQMDPGAFPDPPNGPGDRVFRGMANSNGEFWLNERWRWGWDATAVTDRFFLDDYNLEAFNARTSTSSLYLTGSGDKSWFDARFYYFLGLTSNDNQKQLPVVHPVIDYDYIVDHPVLGGELGWNLNLTSLTRREADFDRLVSGAQCDGLIGTLPENCVQRGIAGTYTRMSANLYWKHTLTDGIGEQWTPFAYLRGDLAWTHLDSDTPVQFVGADDEFMARGLPAIGLEYRYPFIATMSWGSQVIEPIAQVILRPNLQQVGKLPNEDAQSLVYDDTNLFEWDKFSGYDRIEDGSRANVGMQYTLTTNGGGFYNAMVGQSYSIFGDNAFTEGDMANTGLDSGLDKDVAAYVARFYAQPIDNLAFSTRLSFDQESLSVERLEADAIGSVGRLSGSVLYGRYEAQPAIGFSQREGVLGSASYKLDANWTANGGALYDIDEHGFSSAQVGLSYLDECFGMGLQVSRGFSASGNNDPVTRVMFQLSLRTLADAKLTQSLGSSSQSQ
jgi:LPS-assembly protein